MYDSQPMNTRLLLVFFLAALPACGDSDPEPTAPTGDAADTPDEGTPHDTEKGPFTGVLPLVDLNGAGLYDAPFPSDLRLVEGGGMDLSGFPNPNEVDLLAKYVVAAEKRLNGFSLTPSIVFRFDGSLSASSLSTLEEAWKPGSNIILVDVDQDSLQFGRRFPLQSFWWGSEPAKYIDNNTLTLQPLFGTPLLPGTTYACIVTTDVTGSKGGKIGQHPLIRDGLASDGPLGELLSPVNFWLGHGGNMSAESIAVVTVFTTDRPTDGLRALAEFVQDELPAPTQNDIALSEASSTAGGSTLHYDMYEGHYDTPNFQSGDKPYAQTGGQVETGSDGKPIIQETETLRFALSVPAKGEIPANGWPVVMYGHGTGGDWKSFANESLAFTPARELAKLGIAVMAIEQPLHGTRYNGDQGGEIINSFNFFNVDAARTNFRQSAVDVMVQSAFVRASLNVPTNVAKNGVAITFDKDHVFFLGHSHGGIAGALFAPFIKGLQGIVLSGAGGGLSHTTLHRKDLLDIEATLKGLLAIEHADELTLAHPVLALLQNLVDITDPLTYAPLYINPAAPDGDAAPLNLLLTEGTEDQQTPSVTTDNLAAAAEIPLLAPTAQQSVAHTLLGIAAEQRPVSQNYVWKTFKSTAVLAQFDGGDHFVIFKIQQAVNFYTNFIVSTIETGVPVIE